MSEHHQDTKPMTDATTESYRNYYEALGYTVEVTPDTIEARHPTNFGVWWINREEAREFEKIMSQELQIAQEQTNGNRKV